MRSGRKILELQPVIGGSQALAFSRDGRRLATADSDTVARIYDTANGEVVTRYTGFLMEPLAASFTPEGDRLLTSGGDKVIAVLDVATGSTVRQSAKLVDPVQYLEVSPDGALTAAGLMHADNLMMPAPLVISDTESGRTVQEWMTASMIFG